MDNTDGDVIETVKVTDITSAPLQVKSLGSLFSSINKSVSSALNSFMSSQQQQNQPAVSVPIPPAAGAPPAYSEMTKLPGGAFPFQQQGTPPVQRPHVYAGSPSMSNNRKTQNIDTQPAVSSSSHPSSKPSNVPNTITVTGSSDKQPNDIIKNSSGVAVSRNPDYHHSSVNNHHDNNNVNKKHSSNQQLDRHVSPSFSNPQYELQSPSQYMHPHQPNSSHYNNRHSRSKSPQPFGARSRSPSPRRDIGFSAAVTNLCDQAHEIVDMERRGGYPRKHERRK